MAIDIVLFTFMFGCSLTDILFRKVYNAVVAVAVILGFGLNLFYGGMPGLVFSLTGLAAGFALLLVFYVLGGIGAGDVKYLAAVGCLKGFEFVFNGAVYGAVIGGFAAVVVLLAEKRLLDTARRVYVSFVTFVMFLAPEALEFDGKKTSAMPYTLFLSLGMVVKWMVVNNYIDGFSIWTTL